VGDGEEGRRGAERMAGARAWSMRAMMELLERRWGGAEGYVREAVRLSEEEVERVRAVLTDYSGGVEVEGAVTG